jgi:opacity protein-like surface antigen
VKRNCRYLLLISLLMLFCIPFAAAQSGTFSIGFGTNQIDSNRSGLDDYGDQCTPDVNNPYCYPTPGLHGFFLGFGGDLMPWKNVGFGFDISFQPAKGDYTPLRFRQTFYDFNGIYTPINEKRVVVKLKGGIGGAKTGFSIDDCVGTAVCQNYSWGSSNHFQLHAAAGVEIYFTKNAFLRPEFNFRHVTNLTEQFGSNNVWGGMLWLGLRSRGR